MDGSFGNADSWRSLLKWLKKRGLKLSPELERRRWRIGFWTALRDVFPETREQRCWVHKTANVTANVTGALPKSLREKAKAELQDIWMAETRKEMD